MFERDGVKHSLRNGDIVVAVDGTEVSTIQDLQVVVANKKKLKLSVVRTTDGVTAASPEDIAQATVLLPVSCALTIVSVIDLRSFV